MTRLLKKQLEPSRINPTAISRRVSNLRLPPLQSMPKGNASDKKGRGVSMFARHKDETNNDHHSCWDLQKPQPQPQTRKPRSPRDVNSVAPFYHHHGTRQQTKLGSSIKLEQWLFKEQWLLSVINDEASNVKGYCHQLVVLHRSLSLLEMDSPSAFNIIKPCYLNSWPLLMVLF